MLTLNENFLHLQANYLFADIAHRVADFQQTHPDVRLIRLGIGDVTRPLAPAVISARFAPLPPSSSRILALPSVNR